jgi:hypothetical protein
LVDRTELLAIDKNKPKVSLLKPNSPKGGGEVTSLDQDGRAAKGCKSNGGSVFCFADYLSLDGTSIKGTTVLKTKDNSSLKQLYN